MIVRGHGCPCSPISADEGPASKVGCVFPIVISSEFRSEYRSFNELYFKKKIKILSSG